MFTQRLRLFLAASVAAVAAVTTVGSAPAHADVSTSCDKISVSGAMNLTSTVEGDRAVRTSMSGYAPATCGGGRGTPTIRWVVTLSSSATGDIPIYSNGSSNLFYSTYISFPTTTFRIPPGNGTMRLTIRTQRLSTMFNFWVNVGDAQNYTIGVPNDGFDTASASQGVPTSCPTGGPIVGNKGWC